MGRLGELTSVPSLWRKTRTNSNGLRELMRYSSTPLRNRFLPRFPQVEAGRILGIASTGHGASLSFLDATGIVRSSQLERWTGAKHTMLFSRAENDALRRPTSKIDRSIHYLFQQGFGRFPDSCVFEDTIDPWREWLMSGLGDQARDVDLVVTSDGHFATGWARLGPYLRDWFPHASIVRAIEHHEIHQRQAFWASGFQEAAVLTLDSSGEPLPRRGWRKLAGTLSVMNRDGDVERVREWCFPEMSSGALFDLATRHVGFAQGEEGKTMGLSAYGEPDLFDTLRGRLQLHDDGGFGFLGLREFETELERYTPRRIPGTDLTQRHMNVAYAGQAIIELIVVNAWRAALDSTGQRDLAYAGGVALNSVANGRAWAEVGPRRVYIPPNAGDPGQSLGCALFGAYEIAGWRPPKAELSEYLGPVYSEAEIATAVRSSGHPTSRPGALHRTLARCIANGHIVARFDGAAEFGPRALGNRSILADPRRAGMKDFLNLRVKHREPFRPFAPAVLEHRASEWFELDARSPHMLRVVPITRARIAEIPAVAHVDGTARVQTVAKPENPGFWRIVDAFAAATGVPLVLNTSFNLAGCPIVETPADAVRCFAQTEIDVLAVGPYVLSKRPLDEYLASDSGA